MRVGFRTSPQNTDWASLDAAWAEAGQHDVFDSGWLNDHLMDPARERGGPAFEAMTTLAALAHHVPGKTVGQTVLAATFRHPSILAKEALTLDHVTGGRYILGLGAGWHAGEHESFGIDLPPIGERFDRYEATIRVLRALFSDEARTPPGVTLDAPPYRLDGAVMEPGPVHPGGPRIWLGGQGPRGLRLAARYADGWNYASNLGGTLDGFIERRDLLRAACEAIGRDPGTLALSVQIVIPPEGEPRRMAFDRAVAYGRAGASEIILTTLAREGAAGIRRLASEVAEPLKATFADD
jgi:alkanesulfonate monooxygenase SsuD/methylene tetrahydromethanopterin reductase-like flavin-dependent oxidoreductase (luciferase family)